MPGADHFVAFNPPEPERPADVIAVACNGAELAVLEGKCNGRVADLDLPQRLARKFVRRPDVMSVLLRHGTAGSERVLQLKLGLCRAAGWTIGRRLIATVLVTADSTDPHLLGMHGHERLA